MSYRPITDTWILARSKVNYYGAFPSGFLSRARALLSVGLDGAVLHVCGGRVRDYPFSGFGPNDMTLDLDPDLQPNFLADANLPFPFRLIPNNPLMDREAYFAPLWDAILIDRPYTPEDADHYAPGREKLPSAQLLLQHGLDAVRVGGKVGILDYIWPRPPAYGKNIAVVSVLVGFNNRGRLYSVYERTA